MQAAFTISSMGWTHKVPEDITLTTVNEIVISANVISLLPCIKNDLFSLTPQIQTPLNKGLHNHTDPHQKQAAVRGNGIQWKIKVINIPFWSLVFSGATTLAQVETKDTYTGTISSCCTSVTSQTWGTLKYIQRGSKHYLGNVQRKKPWAVHWVHMYYRDTYAGFGLGMDFDLRLRVCTYLQR